jgi:hypothetical protein
VFISDHVASLHAADMGGSQYLPLYLYDDPEGDSPGTDAPWELPFGQVSAGSAERRRRDAISDAGPSYLQAAYTGELIEKGGHCLLRL